MLVYVNLYRLIYLMLRGIVMDGYNSLGLTSLSLL
jgi:hypothetical protein